MKLLCVKKIYIKPPASLVILTVAQVPALEQTSRGDSRQHQIIAESIYIYIVNDI